MTPDEFSVNFRLSLQRALWSAIPDSLRAIAIGWDRQNGSVRFIFEHPANELERTLVEEVETEVIADFDERAAFQFSIDTNPVGRLELKTGESWWAFVRFESKE